MLLKIDFAALGRVRAHARGFGVTLFVNWAVKPFSMAVLGWIFIRHLFAPWAAGRPDRQRHRRPDPAGRRAVIEVPVKLAVLAVFNRSQGWYEAALRRA